MVIWLVKVLSRHEQKAIALYVLEDILTSKDSSIDSQYAELVVEKCIKSTGNKITAFLVKD